MRPLRLKLENFMSFRHAEIDLSRQDIFVITGPTGSGKTTLLDAMSFALYGETPRMGKQGIKELIFRDIDSPRLEARVEFEFSHRGKEYQIIRQIGKTNHRIELSQRLPGEKWKSDSSYTSKSFQDWTAKLLGLNSEAFTRVLVLPQGGFDKFLRHDKPAERRELMLKLSQLEIYQDIHQLAQIEADQLKRQIDTLQLRLQHLTTSSPEYLDQLHSQRVQLSGQLELDSKQIESLQTLLRQQEQQWQLQKQIDQQNSQLQKLQTQSDQMQKIHESWQKGLKLLQLAPLLDQETQLQQQALRLQDAQNQQTTKQAVWQLDELRFQQDYQDWQSSERQRADWLDQQSQWQALQGLVTQFQQQSQALQQSQQDYQGLTAQQENLVQLNQSAQIQLQSYQSKKAELNQAISDLNWNEARYEALQEALPLVQNLYRQWQPDYQARQQQLAALQDEIMVLEQNIHALGNQSEQEQNRIEQDHGRIAEMQTQLEQRKQTDLTVSLRHTLETGKECPVCQQIVNKLPMSPDVPDLTQLQDAFQQAQTQLKQSQHKLVALQKEQQVQDREVYSRQQKQVDLEQEQQNLNQKIEQTLQELQAMLGPEIGQETLAAEYKVNRTLKKQKQSLEDELKQVQQSELTALQNQSQTQQDLNRLASQLEIQSRHVSQQKSALEQSESQLQSQLQVSQDYHVVLQTHLKSLKQQLQQLDHSKQRIEQMQIQLDQERIRLETREQELLEQSQQWHVQSENLQKKLQNALVELALAHSDEARQHSLPEADLQSLQARYQQWQTELGSTQQHLNALQAQFSGVVIQQSDLEHSQAALQLAQHSLQSLNLELGLTEQKIDQTQQALQQSQSIHAQIKSLDQNYQRYARIVEDLATKKLPDFIYHRILERVITQGSHELFKLSQERYRFAVQNEELVVLDAWNAHEPRSIKTLSGGESFMASLALALALNEYLSAGAHLGALFIDEGFGTLDPESLEHAAEVLEVLRARGKCIGVITHIPELAERFETRIQITKSSQGSHLEVVGS